MIGCDREVPRHEWPTDKSLPIVCDPCLRAQTAKALAATDKGEAQGVARASRSPQGALDGTALAPVAASADDGSADFE